MRAKSEYPGLHGDQHNPDGSDPITGIGGLQYGGDDPTYGPENVGDWLYVEATSGGGPIGGGRAMAFYAGPASFTDMEWRCFDGSITGDMLLSPYNFNVQAQSMVFSTLASAIGAAGFGITMSADQNILIESPNAYGVTIESPGGPVVLRGDAVQIVDTAGVGALIQPNGPLLLQSFDDDVQIRAGTGQKVTILDNAGNAKIQWTEGTNDLHIPTGGTIVADL